MSEIFDQLIHNTKGTMKQVNEQPDGGRSILVTALQHENTAYNLVILKNIYMITDENLRNEIANHASKLFYDANQSSEIRIGALQGLYNVAPDMMPYYKVGLKDSNPEIRIATLLKIISACKANRPKPDGDSLALIKHTMRSDADENVRDHAILTMAVIERQVSEFLTIFQGLDTVASALRLSAIPESKVHVTSLLSHLDDAMAIMDWYEAEPENKFLRLNLNSTLNRLVRAAGEDSEIAKRYDNVIISEWLQAVGYDASATYETAVQDVTNRKVGFEKIAAWFNGRGMTPRIKTFLQDCLTQSDRDTQAIIQASHDEMQLREREMMKR
ncbi:MAG: hypothetical protein RLP44_21545 [Aggregatilineales bacterium]